MIKRIAAALALVLLASAVWATVAAAADERVLSLSASKFGFAAEPGQNGSGEVFVINEGAQPISVRIYAADQVIAEDGSASYVAPGVDPNPLTSPASWVTFALPEDAKSTGNIPYVDIEPGGRVPVKFTVEVPENASPGDRQAVLFFEMFSPQGQAEAPTARVSARLGARIQTRVKGEVVEKLDVRPFVMPLYIIGSEPDYTFTVRNEGNIDQRVDARLVVLDRSENERQSSQVLTDTPVYAGSALEKKGVLELQGIAIGPRRVRLVVSYVGDSGVAKTIEKDQTVWAVPVWLVITLAGLFAVFVLAGVWGASSRAARKRMQRGEPPSEVRTSPDEQDEQDED